MLLIPAIDLKDGKCVRLKQGDMRASTTFGDDPAAMPAAYITPMCRSPLYSGLISDWYCSRKRRWRSVIMASPQS